MNINKHDAYDEITELKEYQKYSFALKERTWFSPIWLLVSSLSGVEARRDIALFDCIELMLLGYFGVFIVLGGAAFAFSEVSGGILIRVICRGALDILIIGGIILLIILTTLIVRTIHNIRVDKRIEKEFASGILIELDNGAYARPHNQTNAMRYRK